MEAKRLVILRPTVKRDLSLFSVTAWRDGYDRYLQQALGWSYPVLFWYDGTRVNFYHTTDDFKHFKEGITPHLIADDQLFTRLNSDFQGHIRRLRQIERPQTGKDLLEVYELIGKIMSLYIFIVSDSFVEARPEAWESRHLSEGILYEVDAAVEEWLGIQLAKQGIEPRLAHVMTLPDIRAFLNQSPIASTLSERLAGYVLHEDSLQTKQDFRTFCEAAGYTNPEFSEQTNSGERELQGKTAYPGTAAGRVTIIRTKEDIDRVRAGDILVSVMTNVNYLPAARKAAAIVTDEGGITCHAAIMARELKIPCITGTRRATSVLKDGDFIHVDATTGFITKQ